MREHDDLPYIVIERHSAGFSTFLWGVVIGAGAALLLAPRSGAEIRDDIRERVDRVRSAAEDRMEAARSTVNRTRERLGDRFDSVRDSLDDVRDRIEARAEDARDAIERRRYSGSRYDSPGVAASDLDREVDIVVTEIIGDQGPDDLII
ncbi:MAG: YtxH domain-containing protein [Gemmatimonadota bacterium]|jgi:gas vesicle protein|nr:YtxH domain-containing protein [Gemmatimonadota bacterium]